MRRTTAADAAAVDALSLQSCTDRWRKVAMVAGTSLDEFDAKFPHLPYGYMLVRIIAMKDSGGLELPGNPMVGKTSEVRLAGVKRDVYPLLEADSQQKDCRYATGAARCSAPT